MKILAYILAASGRTDKIECSVPFKLNENKIFFGSCKRPLRKKFYLGYLKNSESGVESPYEDIYILGFNASNKERIRRIVWFGKIDKFFTYEKAWDVLKSEEGFDLMKNHRDKHGNICSPLNLKPIHKNGKMIGYELYGTEHEEKDNWFKDVVPPRFAPGGTKPKTIDEKGKKSIILKEPDKRKDIFLLDCCFICKDIFFAEGEGIEIDDNIVNLLKEVQPEKKGVDDYSVFGKGKKNKVIGLHGSWLEIEGENAEKLLKILYEKKDEIEKRKINNRNKPILRESPSDKSTKKSGCKN